MKLIFKLVFKNILQKKFQTIMIFITFFSATVLTLTSIMFKDTALQAKSNQLRDSTLNSQIKITAVDNQKSIYFSADILDKLNSIEGISNITPRISGVAKINSLNTECAIIGTDLQKQEKVYKFDFTNKANDYSTDKNSIIISNDFAQRHGLLIGSKIELAGTAAVHTFTVKGICKPTGIFSDNQLVFMSLESAQNLLGQKNNISSIGITIADLNMIDFINKNIKKVIPENLTTDKQYDISDYKTAVDSLNIALVAFTIFSLLVALYLCYSIYKTYVFERMIQFGTLRSIGLSRNKLFLLQYLEYIITVVPAVILGIILSFQLVKFAVGVTGGDQRYTTYTNWFVVIIVPLLICISGALSFLYNLYKNSMVGIVGQIKGYNYYYKKANMIPSYIVFAIFVLLSILFFYQNITTGQLYQLIFSLVFCVSAFLLIGKTLTKAFVKILQIVFRKALRFNKFCKEFLYEMKEFGDSMILIILVLAICTVGTMVSKIVAKSAINVYNGTDIIMNNLIPDTNSKILSKIKSLDNVKTVVPVQRENLTIDGEEIILSGIIPDEYSKIAFESFVTSSKTATLNKLKSSSRQIIITQGFAKRHKLKVNQYLTLTTLNGKEKYKIIGIVSSFENMGKVFFISNDNFNKDFAASYTTNFVVTNDKASNTQTRDKIKDISKDITNYNVNTIDDLFAQSNNYNSMIFSIVNIMTGLTFVICIICLINTVTVSSIKRKKTYAIKRAIGMSQGNLISNILGEGLLLGTICGALGIVLGVVLNYFVIRILSYYIGDIRNLSVPIPFVLLFLSMLIGIISFLYPCKIVKSLDVTNVIKGGE